MSLFTALGIGISGLQTDSTQLGSISQNISNVDTTGYKSQDTLFEDLIQFSNDPVTYSPNGATTFNRSLNDLAGTIEQTASSTDLAISGSGFFAVSNQAAAGGSIAYTRVGSFAPDATGAFVNTNGFYLQGWRLNADGSLPGGLNGLDISQGAGLGALTTVNPESLSESPMATTTISPVVSLDASQAVYPSVTGYNPTNSSLNMASGSITPDSTQTVSITDSMNVTHTVTIGYLKTAPNAYSVEVYATPASDVTAPGGQLAYGTITFDSSGAISSISPALSSVNINWQDGATASTLNQDWATSVQSLPATQQVTYEASSSTANMASGSVAPQASIPITVVDNLGKEHQLTMGFIKTGENQWAVEVYSASGDTTGGSNQLESGTLTFNGDGTLASITGLNNPVNVPWSASGTAASSLTFNWGTAGPIFGTAGATTIGRNDGISQSDTSFNVTSVGVDGSVGGSASSISITNTGFVVGHYSDGTTRNLYQIPLANFADPDELESQTGNIFTPSVNSTPAVFNQPNIGGVGSIDPSSLESSNVDISSQLTTMIIAQRAYEDNTKTVSTTDQMLQTLTSMGAT